MMTVCSFALHLADPSVLFSLLYSLSTRSKWLIVLAPHKKPEVEVYSCSVTSPVNYSTDQEWVGMDTLESQGMEREFPIGLERNSFREVRFLTLASGRLVIFLSESTVESIRAQILRLATWNEVRLHSDSQCINKIRPCAR
jgi:hypothetical protein